MRTGRLFLLERQGDLRDELRGVLVLRRAFEINASERPLGREPMLPRVGAELFLCGGQVLVGPVVVETERRRRGQRLDILTRGSPGGTVAQDATSPGRAMDDSTRYIRCVMSVP